MRTYFTVYNSSGVILRTGNCEESFILLQYEPSRGEFIIAEQSDPTQDAVDVVTKKIIPGGKAIVTPPPIPPVDYRTARESVYPSPAEQLDMLWHSMDMGIIPKAQPFYDTINAIKTAHPKPSLPANPVIVPVVDNG